MVKYVIMLAICSMFYMIVNINAVLTHQQKLDRIKVCCKQMLDEGLIQIASFFQVLQNRNNIEIIPWIDSIYNHIITQPNYTPSDDVFDHILWCLQKQDDFDKKIDSLMMQTRGNCRQLLPPLYLFVMNYSTSSNDWYKSFHKYCMKYMRDEAFDGV